MPVPQFFYRLGLKTNLLDLRAAFWLTVGSVLVGTLGFVLIEGYSLADGFYMSVITISTVGFGEVEPLTATGRLFTSGLITLNIGIVAYALATFSYYVIDGKLFELMERNRMQTRVNALSGHTILCGFGRYGKEVARHLLLHEREFVIIEEKSSKLEADEFAELDLPYVLGDATHDEILQEAGITKASGLITALSDDSDNLFIVLSAKDLNPSLRIISRAHQARSRAKMIKAGASHVIMPEQIGGFYMATLMSKPGAVEFFSYVTNELASDIGFEEIRYDQLPAGLRGKNIQELHLRSHSGVNIIGHRLASGRYVVNPGPQERLAEGDSFIVVGSQPQITALREYLNL
ncbi:MAG: potassium channel protein [Bacteroidota bacterium]